MSGIVGVVNRDGAPVDPLLLEQMTASLVLRGPDAQRLWCDKSAGLGHALLRTTFESAQEQQPCSLDGTVWIIADARVDGRPELVRKLRARGRDLSDRRPDVELILDAYHVWGEDCVQHLIGDFAFAIWDAGRQRLFCARDQFGVTPFYYAMTANGLAFSNTLNCLHLHPEISDRLNERAIGDYLLFSYNQDQSTTFFDDIQCLPPAHSLTFEAGGPPRLRRYWTLSEADHDAPREGHREEWVERFRALLEQAVRDRLRLDRIAASMSGGLDSTSVAALAARARTLGTASSEMCAYSLGFDWLLPDHERYYAGLVAEKVGIPIHYLSAESYMLPESAEKAWRLPPEPRFLLRRVPALEIVDIVAGSGGRVLLSGLGGDPALAMPRSSGRDGRNGMASFWMEARHPRRYLRTRTMHWLRARRTESGQGTASPLPAWIDTAFAERLGLLDRREALRAEAAARDGRSEMALSPFWACALSSGDPDFSSLPVKGRHPFFDVRLVEFLRTVPRKPWFRDKELLRAAMRDILPEPIRCRPKAPLAGDFVQALLERGLEPWMEAIAATQEGAEFVDQEWLRHAVQSPSQSLPGPSVSGILLPLSLVHWLRHRHRLRVKPILPPMRIQNQVKIEGK